MARPQFLQRLQHGKLLTESNFPQFVETYNYSVNRCENIKGDADNNFGEGKISVDNTDPEHPVIRFIGKEAAGGKVTVKGTDDTEHTGNEFSFVSASDSNVIFSVGTDGTITVGCYYL